MYNLMSRVFDSPKLPVNVIIVSSWARTGWNVIKPNILIDSTATRDVTAWQQLRGRAMRARRTWDRNAYELITLLLGTQVKGIRGSSFDLPADVLADAHAVNDVQYVEVLSDVHRQLLKESYLNGHSESDNPQLIERINVGRLSKFTQEERENLAVDLMLYKNKYGHWPAALEDIKFLISAKAFVDPTNNGSFGYRLVNDTFKLYRKCRNNGDAEQVNIERTRLYGSTDWLTSTAKRNRILATVRKRPNCRIR